MRSCDARDIFKLWNSVNRMGTVLILVAYGVRHFKSLFLGCICGNIKNLVPFMHFGSGCGGGWPASLRYVI